MEHSLFQYFNDSYDTYNFPDFEPIFPPDPKDLSQEIIDLCGGMYILLQRVIL